MPKPKPLPSQAELKRLFDYDADRGFLIWRNRADCPPQWNGKWAGRVAGGVSKSHGHMVLNLGHRLLLIHRVIWKWVTGEDPAFDIDHRDGDPRNNRLANLRVATKHENLRNCKRHKKKIDDLPKGVSRSSKTGYRAAIYVGGKQVHLGCFSSPEAAHDAYSTAARQAFGSFARFS